MIIYHIAYSADWEKAESEGTYTTSTKGRTLAEQGYIHAGDAPRVAPVANLFYAEDDGLVVLVIDTDRLASPVKYDPAPGWEEPLPHIYGPINPDAVIELRPLDRGEDGKFRFEA